MRPAEAQAALEALEVVRAVHAARGRSEAAEGVLVDVYARLGLVGLLEVAAEASVLLWQALSVWQADPDVPMEETLSGLAQSYRNELWTA